MIAEFVECWCFQTEFVVPLLCLGLQPPVLPCLSCYCQRMVSGDAVEEVCTAWGDAVVVLTGIVGIDC